jgi:hypothetical protein
MSYYVDRAMAHKNADSDGWIKAVRMVLELAIGRHQRSGA